MPRALTRREQLSETAKSRGARSRSDLASFSYSLELLFRQGCCGSVAPVGGRLKPRLLAMRDRNDGGEQTSSILRPVRMGETWTSLSVRARAPLSIL